VVPLRPHPPTTIGAVPAVYGLARQRRPASAASK